MATLAPFVALALLASEAAPAQPMERPRVTGNANVASFSLSATCQWDVPFPSDYFTITDPDMLTGIR